MRGLGLAVDFVASSQRWGIEKPALAFFSRICEAAGLPASRIAYVGDRLDNDVLPAGAAGMFTVFIARGPWGHLHRHRPEVERADARITSLRELLDVLPAPP